MTAVSSKSRTIKTVPGDIFTALAPPNLPTSDVSSKRRIVLIHACNTIGSWGAGIALAFKERFPEHFEVYRQWCLTHRPIENSQARGRGKGGRGRTEISTRVGHNTKTHGSGSPSLLGTCLLIPPPDIGITNLEVHIACLFTSKVYGRNKDTPDEILAATKDALVDLQRQLQTQDSGSAPPWELHACRFNSGKFGVPWERSVAIVEELGIHMTVYVPPE
ncbi:hypothetical protein BDP27DRAFT_1399631 [Rhodocollybia butyracea]|uniref:ADP-ribose 1''-phosphate phosphatase n=1 Tax=Rhodocollybia butyracea TaxID=206335 RepID=A0A9P5UDP4_9AGAR|nr:hypothetical protein BDP27DRAFT_1399631 [Rhodocollybia butyracea]